MKNCTKCGHQNDDSASFCSACGTNFSTVEAGTVATGGEMLDSMKPTKPDNHLAWAILTTLLCCMPFGIASIVAASKVDSLYNNGDYDGAIEASKNAQKWAVVSAIVGVVITILYVAVVFATEFM
ncbi:MAG: zinc-ribbon domain-containing protein [Cryomorphaceae bacterium]|nr:zinc-ribbon domain-containing protein [Cryomorphaceae bacterium]